MSPICVAALQGAPDIVVAVIDTGFDLSHPDLAGRTWTNPGEIPDNGIDDDGNGLVGARAGNSQGGLGSAPNIKLMLLRVTDCRGSTMASTVVMALDYALRMGAHIVSMSLGMAYPYNFQPFSRAPSFVTQQQRPFLAAITPLAAKGVLVVAAAGNEASNLDNLVRWGYPYNPCTVPVHVWGQLSGTSMAAPITAGVAALVASVLGAADGNYYKATLIKSILLGSADIQPGLLVNGSGRVNAFQAVRMASRYLSTNSLNATAVAMNLTTLPTLPLETLPTQALVLQGWQEAVWTLGNPTLLSIEGQTQVDASVRVGSPSFTRWKYSTGWVGMVAASNVTSFNASRSSMYFPLADGPSPGLPTNTSLLLPDLVLSSPALATTLLGANSTSNSG
ncbi:peptidase_S8 domain-containing protein [Haematococcus lacustris]|uniref:Peptidase_S8 domain-containing protein n=1 Tax=Haematococcus lacustris TaxID=44745 RepID=A0A699YT20_HAELA|nr:peptidase_S8 domain-containing protein [Haematococcus lacustris]